MGEEFKLSDEDKKILLKIARQTLEAYAREKKKAKFNAENFREALKAKRGAFVSLHKRGNLRGCIGIFDAHSPLFQTVSEMAISAGWQDPRFPGLSSEELKEVEIEISVLSPLEPAQPEQIEVGKHGIYITKGLNRGVLLPQVAIEYGWDRQTFLEHTCLKAGLAPSAWKESDTTIEIFTAEVFSEKDFE